MKPSQFDKLARVHFGRVLEPYGFSCARSRFATFHRKATGDVFHFIMPDAGTRGAWYDVKVFASTPALDPTFQDDFPEVGIPSDIWSQLSEHGIGMRQTQFNCKSEENMVRRFERTVAPALVNVAVPFLDGIQTLEDLIPHIRENLYLAYALHAVGRVSEARPLLEAERVRLGGSVNPASSLIVANLRKIDELLQIPPT